MYSITVGFSPTLYCWPKPLLLYGSMAFLPDILQLTQAPIAVWFDDIIIVYYYNIFSYVLYYCLLFLLCLTAWHGD